MQEEDRGCKSCIHLIGEYGSHGKHMAVCMANELVDGFVKSVTYERPYGTCPMHKQPKKPEKFELTRLIDERFTIGRGRRKKVSGGDNE